MAIRLAMIRGEGEEAELLGMDRRGTEWVLATWLQERLWSCTTTVFVVVVCSVVGTSSVY